jgi:hypothetical protein
MQIWWRCSLSLSWPRTRDEDWAYCRANRLAYPRYRRQFVMFGFYFYPSLRASPRPTIGRCTRKSSSASLRWEPTRRLSTSSSMILMIGLGLSFSQGPVVVPTPSINFKTRSGLITAIYNSLQLLRSKARWNKQSLFGRKPTTSIRTFPSNSKSRTGRRYRTCSRAFARLDYRRSECWVCANELTTTLAASTRNARTATYHPIATLRAGRDRRVSARADVPTSRSQPPTSPPLTCA